jgi:cytochrome d ubiquinol oxidase subunit I
VAASLVAFVVVYFAVFGAGVLYILRLMAKPPVAHEIMPPNIPLRAAGTTPAAALRPVPYTTPQSEK